MNIVIGKIVFKLFILIFVFFSIFNLNSQTDNSDDLIKGEKPFLFSFYSKEKLILNFDSVYLYSNLLKNEIDLSFKFPFRYYIFNFWINDKFIIDFNQIQISEDEGITDTSLILRNMLNNYISIGFDNKIRLKPVMNIYLNFESGINTPFNDYFSFIINPLTVRFDGDYYFGFNWEIEGSIPITIIPQIENDIVFSPLIYFKLAYEFFRVYGPRKFRFTIITEDYLTFYIPYLIYNNTYENNFSVGMIFNFFGVSPSIYFILNTNGDASTREIINNYIGFKTGISLYIKWFILSFDYSGYTDVNSLYTNWFNRIDTYFKFIINYKKK